MAGKFNKDLIDQQINHKNIRVANLDLTTNEIDDTTFFNFAHTPLVLWNIHNSWKKLIACLSNHAFTIKKSNVKYALQPSWLTARADEISQKNIKAILDSYDNLVVLVSQIWKKYFDRETYLDLYKPRIFCMLPWKEGITNKFPTWWKSKISTRRM